MLEDFEASKPTPVTCLLQQGQNFESFPNSSTDEDQAFKHMSHSHSNQTWGGRWKKQGCSYGYRVECQRRKGLGRSAETPTAAPWPHQCPEAHHHWSLFSVPGKKTLILSSSLRKDAIHHNRERPCCRCSQGIHSKEREKWWKLLNRDVWHRGPLCALH